MRPPTRDRVRLLLPVAAAAAGLVAGGCAREESRPVPEPPAELPSEQELAFEDPVELVEAIQEGTYAEEAGIEEKVEAARLPEPVTVEFVRGTAVPPAEDAEIAKLAAALKQNERFQVDLIGCSDPPGSAALNRRISQQRAESVAERLQQLGVPEAQLGEVVGRGEDCEEQERAVHARTSFREESETAGRSESEGAGDNPG